MSDEKFFIIWNPTFPTPPKKLYDTREQAAAVARSMATKQPGEDFHVLECIESYQSTKPVEPVVTKVKRAETKKEREEREANLEHEKEALRKLGNRGGIPTSSFVTPTEPLAKGRAMLGKRVSLLDIGHVYPALMETAFRNQVKVENRANACPNSWGGLSPANGDTGVVVDAGTNTKEREYAWGYGSNFIPQSVTVTDNDVVLVVRLDKGITVCVRMTAVKLTPDLGLPYEAKALHAGLRYVLDDGTQVVALKGTTGSKKFQGKRTILISTDVPSDIQMRRTAKHLTTTNLGNSPNAFYLVHASDAK